MLRQNACARDVLRLKTNVKGTLTVQISCKYVNFVFFTQQVFNDLILLMHRRYMKDSVLIFVLCRDVSSSLQKYFEAFKGFFDVYLPLHASLTIGEFSRQLFVP